MGPDCVGGERGGGVGDLEDEEGGCLRGDAEAAVGLCDLGGVSGWWGAYGAPGGGGEGEGRRVKGGGQGEGEVRKGVTNVV